MKSEVGHEIITRFILPLCLKSSSFRCLSSRCNLANSIIDIHSSSLSTASEDIDSAGGRRLGRRIGARCADALTNIYHDIIIIIIGFSVIEHRLLCKKFGTEVHFLWRVKRRQAREERLLPVSQRRASVAAEFLFFLFQLGQPAAALHFRT